MGVLVGPSHAASIISKAAHLPFCFSEYAATQHLDVVEEIVPELHAHWSTAIWEKDLKK